MVLQYKINRRFINIIAYFLLQCIQYRVIKVLSIKDIRILGSILITDFNQMLQTVIYISRK